MVETILTQGIFPLPFAIQLTIAFIVLLVGSYTDFRTREVPDWANLGMIGIGFGLNALFSIIYWKINFILASIVGFGIFFALAWLMFQFGQWGGGDSKMLMGLGAIIGIDALSKNFFLFGFLVNALAIGALYGLLWSFYSIMRNRKKFFREFEKYMGKKEIRDARGNVLAVFFVLILIVMLVQNNFVKIMLFYAAVVSILTLYLWIAIKSVESSCMLKYVKPMQLTEGDWIAKDIKIGGKYITGPKDLGIE
ncbi:MAG: A24 family peptidase, partial [Nanoarchaeota archaeon]